MGVNPSMIYENTITPHLYLALARVGDFGRYKYKAGWYKCRYRTAANVNIKLLGWV